MRALDAELQPHSLQRIGQPKESNRVVIEDVALLRG